MLASPCRRGPLDENGLAELLAERQIRAIVDATHPYATTIRATARRVAERMGLPYLSFLRPGVVEAGDVGRGICRGPCSGGAIGLFVWAARPLDRRRAEPSPYVQWAQRSGLPLVVRVLDRAESHAACREAGIPDHRVLVGRGPFSVEGESADTFAASTLACSSPKTAVEEGGVLEKIAAARAEHCRVVVVRRPEADPVWTFSEFAPAATGVARMLRTELRRRGDSTRPDAWVASRRGVRTGVDLIQTLVFVGLMRCAGEGHQRR